MFDKAIERIQQTAQQAAAVTVHPIPGDDSRVIIAQNGTHKFHTVPPAKRWHRVCTLDDLTTAAEKWLADVCWHNYAEITLVIDDADRRDYVRMALEPHEQWAAVCNLPATLSQKAILRWLKITMFGALEDEALPAALATVTFNRSNTGSSTVEHGKESLGRAVENEVQGTTQIPETFRVNVPIFANAYETHRVSVRLSLEIDTTAETFTVAPLPGELQAATIEMQRRIGADLDSRLPDEMTVLFGLV
jgi:hypothetical protein